MKRELLRSVIVDACDGAGIQGVERQRLVDSANDIDHVAVGVFEIDARGIQCGCPATVAGFYLGEDDRGGVWAPGTSHELQSSFPSRFDRRMDTSIRRGEAAFVRVTPEYDGALNRSVVEVTDE